MNGRGLDVGKVTCACDSESVCGCVCASGLAAPSMAARSFGGRTDMEAEIGKAPPNGEHRLLRLGGPRGLTV